MQSSFWFKGLVSFYKIFKTIGRYNPAESIYLKKAGAQRSGVLSSNGIMKVEKLIAVSLFSKVNFKNLSLRSRQNGHTFSATKTKI